MFEVLENLLYLLLGWSLGLLSPLVVERVQKENRKREFRRTLFIELKDLKYRLVFAACIIRHRSATIDREFLNWMIPIISRYDGPHKDPRIVEGIMTLSKLPDEEIKKGQILTQKPGRGLTLKRYTLPFLGSNLPSLSLFDSEFQRKTLNILSEVTMINEDVEFCKTNTERTFDASLSPDNHAKLLANVEKGYSDLAKFMRHVVHLIHELIGSDGS